MSDWKFTWFTNWDEILRDEFMNRWQQWVDKADDPHVFYHPVMGKIWIETYLPLRKIQPLFCLAEQGDMKIFMPLVMWKRNWKNAFLKHIVPLGYTDYDFNDPVVICHPDHGKIDKFWFKLINDLNKFNPDKIEITGIQSDYISRSNEWIDEDECPYIAIKEYTDIDSYLKQNFSRKTIAEIRRTNKRLYELGNIEFVIHTHNSIDKAILDLDEFLEVHSTHWPDAYKPPSYHKNLLQQGMEKGMVYFSVIKMSGVSISWQLGFIFNRKYYFYITTYKPEYAKYGIGKVHLIKTIKMAIDSNLAIFDFLRGAEYYKSYYQSGSKKLKKISFEKRNISGTVKKLAIGLKSKVV
jgi:CelD/BcsL family acetyltransferase involved in cellulose biosynthesis